MSYEPDTNDIRIRQLKEEIAKIREEQFSRAFPTNNVGSPSVVNSDSGIPAPTIGVSSIIPAVIRITKDTGVIDLLNYKEVGGSDKNFTLGEVVTGQSSGATATIGDIDITVTDDSGTLTLVPGSITGTFTDDEGLIGNIDGDAKVDGTLFTQTGRGHLGAGAGSIIADGDNISPPLEIHFIDNADQDGQVVYLRAQDGQTIRLRRPTTNDATTGNLDIDESFNLIENALVFFQYQVASNATPTGGWVPLVTEVSAGVGGTGGAFSFPILYPKENLGTTSGVIDLALSQNDGHYKQVTLDGDASITFSNLPPTINGFKFYLLTIQDGTGGHVYTDLPNTVLFESALLSQLQTDPNAQTLWQFSTADGGANWHANVIQSQGSVAGQTPWLSDINANTFNLFNLDVLRYADGLQPGADGVIGFGVYGSAVENDTKMKWSIPRGETGNPRFYEWQFDLQPAMTLQKQPNTESWTLDLLFQGIIQNTKGISFFHTAGALSSITPGLTELRYDNGFGTGQGGLHAFYVAGSAFAQFEIREDVIRANRNLDMITNNIFDVDVVEWASTGGFLAGTNHGIRSIGGGNTGLELNVPKDKTFRILVENFGQTDSDVQYEFTQNELEMNNNNIETVTAIRHTNGAFFADLLSEFNIIGGRQGTVPDADTQNIVFKIQQKVGFDTYVTRDVMEMTGSEFFSGGGLKMHTDINMQTNNIHNIDVLKFVQDGGEILDDEYAIGVDITGITFNFNVPLNKKYGFMEDNESIAFLDKTGLNLVATPLFTDPVISARELFISGIHTDGVPVDNGSFRLVDNAGSIDVMVFTGGGLVNLTSGAGGTSFIGFNADDDLRMNTFNITGVDVLRFQVDGGVIGFGEYGISTDAFTMNFSTPNGRGYTFMDNLDPIAFLSEDQFQLLGNAGNPDPSIIGREFLAIDHSAGTTGMIDGAYRLVSNDVIVRSGGTNVNLTTLSAGGADNLGDHIATQDLNMSGFFLQSYAGFTSTFGHSMFLNAGSITWDLDSPTQAFIWSGDGGELMTLTNTGIDIQGGRVQNLANPIGPLDAVNLQTLDSGFVTTNTNQTTGLTGNKTWTGNHNFDGSAMVIGADSGDIVQILSRVSGALVPNAPATGLGDVTRTWNIFASQFRFGGGTIVDAISNIPSAFGSTELMTAQAIQIAISGGAGGSFVTTNTNQSSGLTGNKTWDGAHTFNSITQFNGSVTLGNNISTDLVLFNSRVAGAIEPTSSGLNLGSSSRRWDLFGQGLNLQLGVGVNDISNSLTAFGSTQLMTANAIQNAILSFGGGGGVQLGDSPFWTGSHIHNGSTHSINSSAIFLGNSTGDTMLITARVQGNIIPTQDGNNLGDTSRRWDLFGQAMSLQFGNTVTNISNSSTQSSSSALMTANAIQNAISAGGGGVALGDNPLWTGFHQWTNTATFQSVLNIQGTTNMFGTLAHTGSRVGFYGTTPVTRSSGWFVSGGPDDRTLFVNSASTLEVAEVLGTLIRQLERVGIII